MGEKNKFSAGEQALGYIYQLRYALYALMKLPETDGVYIECHDDVSSVDAAGAVTSSSLKHKKAGDTVTDLSVDFWKSVRIWLKQYSDDGTTTSSSRFFIVTTATVLPTSFLTSLLQGAKYDATLVERVMAALESSTSALIVPIREDFKTLSDAEQVDFFSRITVFDGAPRIRDLPALIIAEHFKTIRRKYKKVVFEHLEGWWVDQAIKLLDKEIPGPLRGAEAWDRLTTINDGYRDDDLPINFRGKRPPEGVDAAGDGRLFVRQLREIGLSTERIEGAIVDYYRAFEQRSSWAREDVLMSGEVELYEGSLIEEWGKYRAFIMDDVSNDAAEERLVQAGREVYKWAEFNTSHLRIRKHVNEAYVVRGGFHILANERPEPRVHWHPKFLQRLGDVLEERP